MPQLDFSTYPSQIFWLVVCFAALYFVLAVIVIPRLAKVQTLRFENTAGKRKDAEIAVNKAEAILADYEAKLNESKSIALKQAQALRGNTDKDLLEKNEATKILLKSKISDAEKEISDFVHDSQKEKIAAAASTTQEIIKNIAAINISENEAMTAIEELK